MPPRPRLSPALIRQIHVYVSAFVAPSLLFFATTGALQTFRLPDKPAAPPALVKLARLHKDDVFAGKPERRAPPKGAGHKDAGPPRPEHAATPLATTALKWFFATASVGMIATTLFGLWMGLAHSRRKALVWACLAAGTAAPIALVMAAGGAG